MKNSDHKFPLNGHRFAHVVKLKARELIIDVSGAITLNVPSIIVKFLSASASLASTLAWAINVSKPSVAICARRRPHMLQISTVRDDSFLKFNSAMTLRHSRRRDKIYLNKLFYLRNFLNLLQLYRVYLSWKFRKRLKRAIAWRPRPTIAWKHSGFTLAWSSSFYQPAISTAEIFRYHDCQLTVTSVIRMPRLFSFAISASDKTFHITFGREVLRRNLTIVCELVDDEQFTDDDDEDDYESCDGSFDRWCCNVIPNQMVKCFHSSRSNADELVRSVPAVGCKFHHGDVGRQRPDRAYTSVLHQFTGRWCYPAAGRTARQCR